MSCQHDGKSADDGKEFPEAFSVDTKSVFGFVKDRIRLFVYGISLAGYLGEHITEKQVEESAKRYEVLLWLYSKTGVSRKAKEVNPRVLTFLYYDAIFAGYYKIKERTWWMPPEDWFYVDKHDNMFAKNCESGEEKCRIRNPIWRDEWLMDISDFDEYNLANTSHWVNFFIHISKRRMEEDGFFDGLFIDELMLPYTLIMPENMPDFDSWFEKLLRMAKAIRENFKGIPLIFNGLQQNFIFYPRMKELLEYTDGALFECFVLCWMFGPYMGRRIWEQTLSLSLELEKEGKVQFLQSIWDMPPEELTKEMRLLALGSYYLVRGGLTFFYLNILGAERRGPIYLPEFELNLGRPLKDVNSLSELKNGGFYMREYENGWVIVNPDEKKSFEVKLRGVRVFPYGVFIIGKNGVEGTGGIKCKRVERFELLPASGDIILKEKEAERICEWE